MFEKASLNDLEAFGIGHAQDIDAGCGCSVIVAPAGAVCGVDVRGGAPATRETDLLKPENMVQDIHAVVLSGGSAFGLEASCGVTEELAHKHIGFHLEDVHVPIVVSACLFDLTLGKNTWPNKEMGVCATRDAFSHMKSKNKNMLERGNVGVGCGTSVGKLAEPHRAMKSGFGWSCLRVGDVVVAACVAINALGCVCDETGTWIAGVLDDEGQVMEPLSAMELGLSLISQTEGAHLEPHSDLCKNTTLGVVLTNAHLNKAQATKCASITHDAYARAIKPVHTSNDGDTIFALSSQDVEAPFDLVAALATEAMQEAIVDGIKSARGAYGLKSAFDLAKS